MLQTFATIIASLYFVSYTAFIAMLLWHFSNLSSYAQNKATIDLGFTGILLYLVSIAWLITKAIS